MLMNASRYLVLAVGLLGAVMFLHQRERLIAFLPEIFQSNVQEVRACMGKSEMVRLGCMNGVSFADMRKVDMRRNNRVLSHNGIHALFTKAR